MVKKNKTMSRKELEKRSKELETHLEWFKKYMLTFEDQDARFVAMYNLTKFFLGISEANILKTIGMFKLIEKELLEEFEKNANLQANVQTREEMRKDTRYIG